MVAANGGLDEATRVAGGPLELILAEGHGYGRSAQVAPGLAACCASGGGLRARVSEMSFNSGTDQCTQFVFVHSVQSN
jgi:hypothetical protein